MITIGAIVLVAVAIVASYAVARRLYSTPTSLLAVVTVAAGSVLLPDVVSEPSIMRALSVAIVAIAMLILIATGSTGSWRVVAIVAVAALALAGRGGLTAAGGGRGPIDALWSAPAGLFATSPAIYLATIGFIPLWRRDRRLTTAAVILFGLALASASRSAAAGPRGYFDVLLPFFVCGMAALLDAVIQLTARRPALIATALLAILVLWNITLVGVTRAGGHRIGEPVSFGDLGAAQAGLLHDWVGHLPSAPANLIYGVRHGVGPGRYDVFRPNRFFVDPSRRSERIDIGAGGDVFLEDGWHAAEHAGPLSFRWSQRESGLSVPLDRPDAVRIVARARAFSYTGAPAQSMLLAVNGRALPPIVIEPDWHEVQWEVPRDYWRSGINRLSLRFGYEARPSEVAGGGDTRLLAAAIDEIRLTLNR